MIQIKNKKYSSKIRICAGIASRGNSNKKYGIKIKKYRFTKSYKSVYKKKLLIFPKTKNLKMKKNIIELFRFNYRQKEYIKGISFLKINEDKFLR